MPKILLTGATGYVGSHLLPKLQAKGWPVRCLVRQFHPKLPDEVEVVQGDLLEPETLLPALEGVHTVIYLVHSMGDHRNFAEFDRRAASNMAEAAEAADVTRIIYLGGLGDDSDDLSEHLRSRHEVGQVLASTSVHVTEFRASIVLGPGSLSFEMIRALVERLPVMVTPKWVRSETQPIGVEDLLAYLVAGVEQEDQGHTIYEIGGANRITYMELMREYARQRKLRRFMIPISVISPHLSGLWLGLVTPLHAAVGRDLVTSLKNPTVVRDPKAREVFAEIEPTGCCEAIAAAIRADEGPPHTDEFVFRSEIPVSAEALFHWHSQPGAFEALLPDWEHIKVMERQGGIKTGDRTVLRIYVGPFHKTWIAEHTDFTPGRYFCDVQIQGPFVYWKHRHYMRPIDDQRCILEDRVRYAPPFGRLGQRLLGRYLRRRLMRTFRFRHEATREAVAKQPPQP